VNDEQDGRDGGRDEQGGELVSAETPRRGRVRRQDETTTPREPTVAERRARDRALRRAQEAEEQRLSADAAARKKRKRVLVGSGAAAGLAAVLALGYVAAQPEEEITAQCVDEAGVIVDDSNCAVPADNNGTYAGGGGFAFFPIFIGGGGRQYHYNYGSTGAIGQRAVGGTTAVPPDGTRVRTSAGSSTVTRGGLGVSRSSPSVGGNTGRSGAGGVSGGTSSRGGSSGS
jgi:hypothetical protein